MKNDKKTKIYTKKEIVKNIEKLQNKIFLLTRERLQISQNISSLKKQVKTWEDLDTTQIGLNL